MKTKLTLRMDQEVIERGKTFARVSGRSVSRIVADYFALLGAELPEQERADTPVVASLRGALKRVDVDLLELRRWRDGGNR